MHLLWKQRDCASNREGFPVQMVRLCIPFDVMIGVYLGCMCNALGALIEDTYSGNIQRSRRHMHMLRTG